MTQIYAIVQWFSDSKLFKTMVSRTKQTLEGVQTEDFSNLGLPGERRLGAQRNHQMLPAHCTIIPRNHLRNPVSVAGETTMQWRLWGLQWTRLHKTMEPWRDVERIWKDRVHRNQVMPAFLFANVNWVEYPTSSWAITTGHCFWDLKMLDT